LSVKNIQGANLMIRLFTNLTLLTIAALTAGVLAQSNLPACQGANSSEWSNCFGSRITSKGNKYIGEFRDGIFNGYGTLDYIGGDKYLGEFKDGNFNGQGTYAFADGGKYVGEFKDDKFHGQGTITFKDGHKYIGDHKDNKRDGQGVYSRPDGSSALGEWKNNLPNGRFIEYRANKSVERSGIFEGGKLITPLNIDPSIFTRIKLEQVITPVIVASAPVTANADSTGSLKERLEKQKQAENLDNQRKLDEKKLDEINAAKNSIAKELLVQNGYKLNCRGRAGEFGNATDFSNDMMVTSKIFNYAIVDDQLLDIRTCSPQNPDRYCAKKVGLLQKRGSSIQFTNAGKVEWEYDASTSGLIYDLNGKLLEFSCKRIAYKD
jgi:hypothetical protein